VAAGTSKAVLEPYRRLGVKVVRAAPEG
jgi:hypothetical protein